MLATKLHHRPAPHVHYKCIVQPLSPQSCVIRSRSGKYLSRKCVQGRRLIGFYSWVHHIRDAYKFVGRERLMALGHTAAINIEWKDDYASGAMAVRARIVAQRAKDERRESEEEEAQRRQDAADSRHKQLTNLECAQLAGYVSAA